MPRYIDADVLKRNIRVNLMPNVDVDGTLAVENAERYFLNLIDKTSTADVVEVKHGFWKEDTEFVITDNPDDDGYWRTIYICSECERTAINKEPYCHCGAKIDGEKK